MASSNSPNKSIQQLRLTLRQSQVSAGSEHTDGRLGTRSLKIESHGDFAKGQIKPKIRLTGRWLERAGFKPGSRVLVKLIASGVIELRSADTSTTVPPDQPF